METQTLEDKVEDKEVDNQDHDEQEQGKESGEEDKNQDAVSERPSRERKLVDRYSVPSVSKLNPKKPISIDKGRGTPLKDIPNVAFKLSKRKADDNLQLLHTILYGKKGKAQTLKRNIGRFSGFVWVQNEEKQRSRVKEKLDKCVKEKLIDFCDVLNIPINRAIFRKEDLCAKLLDFLESPHSTTDVILADQDQRGQKRKRNATLSKPSVSKEAPSDAPEKKQKKLSNSAKKQKKSLQRGDEDDVHDKAETDDFEDNTPAGDDAVVSSKEESDDGKSTWGEEEDQPTVQGSDKSAYQKKDTQNSESKGNDRVEDEKKVVPSKPLKNKSSKKGVADTSTAKSLSKPRESTAKKQKPEKRSQKEGGASSKMKLASEKQPNKSSMKGQAKDEGKNKKKAKAEPGREEMRAVVVDILKEVDFNTATLSDILKQLGTHFGMGLMHRKAELKDIITEVINNMTDDEEES